MIVSLILTSCAANDEDTPKKKVQTDAYIRMFDGTVLFFEDVETTSNGGGYSSSTCRWIKTQDGTCYYVANENLILVEHEAN